MSKETLRDTLLRQVLPPALTIGPDRVNVSPRCTKQKQTSDLYTCTLWVEQDNGIPKKPSSPQLPSSVLGTFDHIEREEQAHYNEEK